MRLLQNFCGLAPNIPSCYSGRLRQSLRRSELRRGHRPEQRRRRRHTRQRRQRRRHRHRQQRHRRRLPRPETSRSSSSSSTNTSRRWSWRTHFPCPRRVAQSPRPLPPPLGAAGTRREGARRRRRLRGLRRPRQVHPRIGRDWSRGGGDREEEKGAGKLAFYHVFSSSSG